MSKENPSPSQAPSEQLAEENHANFVDGDSMAVEPSRPATTHDNPKYGFDQESWANQPDEQQKINRAGIAAVREALKRSKEQ